MAWEIKLASQKWVCHDTGDWRECWCVCTANSKYAVNDHSAFICRYQFNTLSVKFTYEGPSHPHLSIKRLDPRWSSDRPQQLSPSCLSTTNTSLAYWPFHTHRHAPTHVPAHIYTCILSSAGDSGQTLVFCMVLFMHFKNDYKNEQFKCHFSQRYISFRILAVWEVQNKLVILLRECNTFTFLLLNSSYRVYSCIFSGHCHL